MADAPRGLSGHPTWLQDLDAALPVTSCFVIHGNLRDRYLVELPEPREAGPAYSTLDFYGAVWDTLRRSGFELIIHHTPAWTALLPEGDPQAQKLAVDVFGIPGPSQRQPMGPDELTHLMISVTTNPTHRVALLVDYVSQWRPPGETPTDPEHAFMRSVLTQVHRAQAHAIGTARPTALRNPVIWMVDRPADLPSWLVGGSDGIRQISVPAPDLDARAHFASLLLIGQGGVAAAPERTARFAGLTEGMTLRAMVETVQIAHDRGLGLDRLDDAVRAHRVGMMENPWAKPVLQERIRQGEAILGRRVKGQQRAVRHALDILIRSTTGLTGAERGGSGGGPRGILFFAGPTGVGKTELAKAMAELVFGDERAYVRFDMSEFLSEHAEARLIGSPPGYVGHGEGGELTNAVRQRPFSIILFDEIEKAHPRILDKFLQILSDGRLTDGSGDTVHFSEAIIVFTSNLGVPPVPDGEVPPRGAALADLVIGQIERAFTDPHGINRPELLGRIGDNIVVFDYINPETAVELAHRFIDNVLSQAATHLRLEITLDEQVRALLVTEAVADLSKGGRGIGRAVESVLVNPLARALFHRTPGTDRVRISGLATDPGGWRTVTLT